MKKVFKIFFSNLKSKKKTFSLFDYYFFIFPPLKTHNSFLIVIYLYLTFNNFKTYTIMQ